MIGRGNHAVKRFGPNVVDLMIVIALIAAGLALAVLSWNFNEWIMYRTAVPASVAVAPEPSEIESGISFTDAMLLDECARVFLIAFSIGMFVVMFRSPRLRLRHMVFLPGFAPYLLSVASAFVEAPVNTLTLSRTIGTGPDAALPTMSWHRPSANVQLLSDKLVGVRLVLRDTLRARTTEAKLQPLRPVST